MVGVEHRKVALIGLPGAGKSTVGRQLARRLDCPFLDTDAVIEEQIACSIVDYFERFGEAAFRDVESRVIDELTKPGNGVLATGGGAVLRAENRACLQQRTHVVYLHSSPEEVVRRVRHATNRPLLRVADPAARLRELYAVRDPLYREIAHFTIETGRPTVATLVNMIQMQLELAGDFVPK